MRLTFRKEHRSGRCSLDYYPAVACLDGREIITFRKFEDDRIYARIQVNKGKEQKEWDKAHPENATSCSWMWGTMKMSWENLDEAKAWVRKNILGIWGVLADDVKKEIDPNWKPAPKRRS